MNFKTRVFALSAIFLGVGILMAVFLPSCVMVVVTALAIITLGILCLKC